MPSLRTDGKRGQPKKGTACWRTGRPHECDREGHPEPGRKAPAKTSGILALFQAASCSDDVRGSTRHPAQSTGHKLEPKVVPEKEEMLAAELRGVRERTLAFIEKTRDGDLSKYRMAHPFLGSLNAYQWLDRKSTRLNS